jgi:hypothetical protein
VPQDVAAAAAPAAAATSPNGAAQAANPPPPRGRIPRRAPRPRPVPLPDPPPRVPSRWDDIADPRVANNKYIADRFRDQAGFDALSATQQARTHAFVTVDGQFPDAVVPRGASPDEALQGVRRSGKGNHAEDVLMGKGDIAAAVREAAEKALAEAGRRVKVNIVVSQTPCGSKCSRTLPRYVRTRLRGEVATPPPGVSQADWDNALRQVDLELHTPIAYEGKVGNTASRDLNRLENGGLRVVVFEDTPGVPRVGNSHRGAHNMDGEGSGGGALNDTLRYLDEYRTNFEVVPPRHWSDAAQPPRGGTPWTPRTPPPDDGPPIGPATGDPPPSGPDGGPGPRPSGQDPAAPDGQPPAARTDAPTPGARSDQPAAPRTDAPAGQTEAATAPTARTDQPGTPRTDEPGTTAPRPADHPPPGARADEPGATAPRPAENPPPATRADEPGATAPRPGEGPAPAGRAAEQPAAPRDDVPAGPRDDAPEAPAGARTDEPGATTPRPGDEPGATTPRPTGLDDAPPTGVRPGPDVDPPTLLGPDGPDSPRPGRPGEPNDGVSAVHIGPDGKPTFLDDVVDAAPDTSVTVTRPDGWPIENATPEVVLPPRLDPNFRPTYPPRQGLIPAVGRWIRGLMPSHTVPAARLPETQLAPPDLPPAQQVDLLIQNQGPWPRFEPSPLDVGIRPSSLYPDRFLTPRGADRRLAEAIARYGRDNPEQWIRFMNPNFGRSQAFNTNCTDNMRAYADARQTDAPYAASGDRAPHEVDLTPWWSGTMPTNGIYAQGLADLGPFQIRAFDQVARQLAGKPPGTVAIIGVGWEPTVIGGAARRGTGHVFGAEVGFNGQIKWVDPQNSTYSHWPPRYPQRIVSLRSMYRDPTDLAAGWRTDGPMDVASGRPVGRQLTTYRPTVQVGHIGGGTLAMHEALPSGIGGPPGHTLLTYTGRSDAELAGLLGKNPDLSMASSFTSPQAADHWVGQTLNANFDRHIDWLVNSTEGRLVLELDHAPGWPTGQIMLQGQTTSVPAGGVRVVLERRPWGSFPPYLVVQAQPINPVRP